MNSAAMLTMTMPIPAHTAYATPTGTVRTTRVSIQNATP